MTEKQLTRRSLKAYAQHCRELVRDIDHVLHDRRLEIEKGVTFTYAVDFSEVFGYVLPQQPHESWSFEALIKITEEEKLHQFRVLARFFAQEKIYLPAPYAIELRTFYDRLRLATADDLMTEAKLALNEILQLRDRPEIQALIRSSDGNRSAPIPEDEKKKIVDFLADNASALRAFHRGVALRPFSRLTKLLERKRLIDLAGVSMKAPAATLPIVQDRFTWLQQQRKHLPNVENTTTASFIDAVALEVLRRANLDAPQRKQRILLVSRSHSLMRLVEREAREGLWPSVGRIVRHPRTFDPICRPPGKWTDKHAQDLTRRRGSLQVFVSSAITALNVAQNEARLRATGDLKHDTGEDTPIALDDDLQKLLEHLHEEWSLSENLAAALESDDEDFPADNVDDATVTALLSLIERENVFDLVTSRLRKLFKDLNRGHEDLGFYLQQRSADRTYGNLVYPLEFKDTTLDELSQRIAGDWRVSFTEAVALFDAAAEVKSNYERLLATALSLSALGRWQVAEDYVTRALLEARIEQRSPREAKFLLAICIRMGELTVDRLRDALKAVDEALSELPDDPRYLKEKATIQLRWNRLAHQADGDQFRTDDLPTFDLITQFLTRALANTTNDKLIAQIHNNLCYMYISPPIGDRAVAINHLQNLEKVLQRSFPDPATWPVWMHDTILMARFRLYKEEATVAQLESWVRQLEAVTASPESTPLEKQRFERHVEEIRVYIREREGGLLETP